MNVGGSNQPIQIVIIDKQKLFREGIQKVLDAHSSVDVVAEGDTIKDALQLVSTNRPQILLIDIHVIKENEFAAISKIVNQFPMTHVVILSERDDHNYMIEALKAGASGYFLKEMNADTFIQAIKAVASGKFWFHAHVTDLFIRNYYYFIRETLGNVQAERDHKKPVQPLHLFTAREFDVLELLAKGYSNKVIAEKLNITTYTVSSHVRNILLKSKANDRTHAVIIAIENGWVTVERKKNS